MGIYCGRAAANTWSLYLTSSAIHYTYHGGYNCDRKNWRIPLTDVQGIYMQYEYDIVVEMESAKAYRYVSGPWLRNLTGVRLTHCSNAREFVQAVKHQMDIAQLK